MKVVWRAARPLAAVALAAGMALPSAAAPPTGVPADGLPKPALLPADADHRFLLEAAGTALYMLEAGRLADQRARNPMVRTYATMLVQQRLAANDELRALMQARGLAWPAAPPAALQAVLDALGTVTGDLFDRRFIEGVGIVDHQRELMLFEAAHRQTADPALREWTARMLDLLKKHLAAARQLPVPVKARARVAA